MYVDFIKGLFSLLQELEEIYIDTSNTLNVAIEGHALLLLTKVKQIIVNSSSDLGDTAAANAAIRLVVNRKVC